MFSKASGVLLCCVLVTVQASAAAELFLEPVLSTVTFGGFYLWDATMEQCTSANPLTNQCTCATSTASDLGFPYPTLNSTTFLSTCYGATPGAFSGIFVVHTVTAECRMPNKFTAACACPSITVHNLTSMYVDTAGKWAVTVCIGSQPDISFGGGFRDSCEDFPQPPPDTVNPFSAACSCVGQTVTTSYAIASLQLCGLDCGGWANATGCAVGGSQCSWCNAPVNGPMCVSPGSGGVYCCGPDAAFVGTTCADGTCCNGTCYGTLCCAGSIDANCLPDCPPQCENSWCGECSPTCGAYDTCSSQCTGCPHCCAWADCPDCGNCNGMCFSEGNCFGECTCGSPNCPGSDFWSKLQRNVTQDGLATTAARTQLALEIQQDIDAGRVLLSSVLKEVSRLEDWVEETKKAGKGRF